MKYYLLLLALFAFASGCTPASDSPGQATATPNIMPRLDPSPTPSGSTLPLTCQVTDLKVYINEMDGYCFAFPDRFTLGSQPPDTPNVQGPPVDDSTEPIHARVSVEVGPTTPGKTLREQAEVYLRDFSVVDPATFTWSQVTVGGKPGWMVEPVPVMLAYRIIFVQHNGNLYRLMYWPVDDPNAQADVEELTRTTLGSFAFTK